MWQVYRVWQKTTVFSYKPFYKFSIVLFCYGSVYYKLEQKKKITNFDSQVIASILKRRGVEHRDNRLTDFCRQDIKGI